MQKRNPLRFLVAACTLCCLMCTAVIAQQPAKKQTADVTVKNLTDSMKLKLALTDAQYTKVYTINGDFAAKLKAVKDSKDDKEVKKDKAKVINKEWADALKGVLTDAQYKKFDEEKKHEKKQLKKAAKNTGK